ncbi:hypothetical protein [Cypionkella sp.]|uniref:hypothetical protein n=1 Tax=Cypionkella sp. TaxID=2811411 RepID=UPI002726CA61|nr:hypothetical protein [Cypionkella sp.]MDO8985338.1 hypothetical protein [Cypionkella sp.]
MSELDGSPAFFAVGWSIKQTHQERFELIEQVVDQCYRELVEKRQAFHTLGEDQLSLIICSMIAFTGAAVSHDAQIGGHVDIVVRGPNAFLWIGEAKIYNGPAYVMGGFEQLSTRYGVAGVGCDRGEIIIYCKQPNATRALVAWRDHLVGNGVVEIGEDKSSTSALVFRSKHSCPGTGCDFLVRHRIVPLHFRPTK